jgi:hypothetical protein
LVGEPVIHFDVVKALTSILAGVINPLIIVPAIVIGALARRWWQALLGALVVAAAVFAIRWAAFPVTVLAAAVWTSAAFLAARRWRGGADTGPIRQSIFGLAVGFILGGLFGGGAGVALGAWYVEAAQVSSFEGKSGYVVIFLFLFPGVIIGAATGAVLGWLLGRRAGAARFAADRRMP